MKTQAVRETLICTLLAALLVMLSLLVRSPDGRILVLRAILIVMTGFEFTVGALQAFTTGRFMGSRGWNERQPYFGFVQDLGLYQLSLGLGFGLASINPIGNLSIVYVGAFVNLLHGLAHVSRYFGGLTGRETYFQPKELELRLGQPLLLVPIGLLLFHP